MADINLEAEQVIGEEQEEAPERKRGGLAVNKMILIFGGLMVVEAIVLVTVFNVISGGTPAEAEQAQPEIKIEDQYDKGRMELGEISFIDDSNPAQRADRVFHLTCAVVFEKKTYEKLVTMSENNDAVMELVKDDLRRVIRAYLIKQGLEALRSSDSQQKLPDRLKSVLGEERPSLKIQSVTVEGYRTSRF